MRMILNIGTGRFTGRRAAGACADSWLALAWALALALVMGAAAVPAQTQSELEELRQELEALRERVDMLGPGPAGDSGVRLGGYAEMHYNAPEEGTTQLDFHRFVLSISKPIGDWIFFNSEIELEHGFVNDGDGALELEQAYLDFFLGSGLSARAGVILAPVGIVNPRHEPTTFYGVERPAFHKSIIPTTWFDHGAGLLGNFGGVSFEAYLMSPLDASQFRGQDGIRAGRQKAHKSETESLALTGAVRYRAPGLSLGGSFWRGNSISAAVRDCARGGVDAGTGTIAPREGCDNTAAVDLDSVVVQLFALEFEFDANPFQVRAEYATGTIENSGKLNQLFGNNASSAFDGFYIEPALRFFTQSGHEYGFFVRFEDVNPQADVEQGSPDDTLNFITTVVGANYWPHPDVVLKADVASIEPDEGDSTTGYNLGVGWVF